MSTTLCSPCEQFAATVIRQDFSTWIFNDYNEVNAGFVYPFMSYTDLAQSRSGGCTFCSFLCSFVGSLASRLDQIGDLQIQIQVTTPKTRWSEPRYAFNLVIVDKQDSRHLVSSQFQIFFALAAESRNTPPDAPLSRMPLEISTHANTPECLALANAWVTQCKNAHSKCMRRGDVLLPTRVIDVGVQEGFEEPRLVLSHGVTGKYMTLSYCWGQNSHVATTRDNIGHHCQSIELQKLPKTLSDAILITRALGYRYLWIDALCIVQDDPEDWKREASNMCSVYENGDFCLGALNSSSSDGGLLHNRSWKQVFATVSDMTIGIRELPSAARHLIPSAPLETRAWTLQERVLTPAMLYFGADQLLWECRTGMASESSPEVVEDQISETDSYYGRSVHDLKLVVHDKAQLQDIGIWYDIVEEYSRRALSNSNDRLAALHGLAVKFESCIDATYLFGLWSSDLHRGLLWSVSEELKADQVLKLSESLPSWSWMSIDARISISRKSTSHTGHDLIPRATFENFEISHSPRATPTAVDSSLMHVIKVTGHFVEGACLRTSKNTRHCNLITYGSTSFLDYVACTLDRVSNEVRRNEVVPQAYFCLLVAEQRLDEYAVQNLYLIVEKADADLEDIDASKCFRRAGFGWSSVLDEHPSGVLSDAVQQTIFLI